MKSTKNVNGLVGRFWTIGYILNVTIRPNGNSSLTLSIHSIHTSLRAKREAFTNCSGDRFGRNCARLCCSTGRTGPRTCTPLSFVMDRKGRGNCWKGLFFLMLYSNIRVSILPGSDVDLVLIPVVRRTSVAIQPLPDFLMIFRLVVIEQNAMLVVVEFSGRITRRAAIAHFRMILSFTSFRVARLRYWPST